MKILANDGLSPAGIKALEESGFEVITTKVAQEQVANFINDNQVSVLLVRSATKVRKDLIDACPNLKIIGRGGVGMDNIDVDYAREKGIAVINTPASSSESVAELVFAHLFTGVRFLHDANRNMPLEGDTGFEKLKKSYAAGIELRGKTLGLVGFGRIGQAVARMGIGLGMRVIMNRRSAGNEKVTLTFFDGRTMDFEIENKPFDELLATSDFISLHVPAQDEALISEREFLLMNDGVGIVNCARGGVIDEVALIEALENGKVAFAGLDVFENEPNPAIQVLMHPQVSLSPHIGASTLEAQERIGTELAAQILALAGKVSA